MFFQNCICSTCSMFLIKLEHSEKCLEKHLGEFFGKNPNFHIMLLRYWKNDENICTKNSKYFFYKFHIKLLHFVKNSIFSNSSAKLKFSWWFLVRWWKIMGAMGWWNFFLNRMLSASFTIKFKYFKTFITSAVEKQWYIFLKILSLYSCVMLLGDYITEILVVTGNNP